MSFYKPRVAKNNRPQAVADPALDFYIRKFKPLTCNRKFPPPIWKTADGARFPSGN